MPIYASNVIRLILYQATIILNKINKPPQHRQRSVCKLTTLPKPSLPYNSYRAWVVARIQKFIDVDHFSAFLSPFLAVALKFILSSSYSLDHDQQYPSRKDHQLCHWQNLYTTTFDIRIQLSALRIYRPATISPLRALNTLVIAESNV